MPARTHTAHTQSDLDLSLLESASWKECIHDSEPVPFDLMGESGQVAGQGVCVCVCVCVCLSRANHMLTQRHALE